MQLAIPGMFCGAVQDREKWAVACPCSLRMRKPPFSFLFFSFASVHSFVQRYNTLSSSCVDIQRCFHACTLAHHTNKPRLQAVCRYCSLCLLLTKNGNLDACCSKNIVAQRQQRFITADVILTPTQRGSNPGRKTGDSVVRHRTANIRSLRTFPGSPPRLCNETKPMQ